MTDFKGMANKIWSVADLLRGDYRQSDYGKVILPMTVLRRLDCILAPNKQAAIITKSVTTGVTNIWKEVIIMPHVAAADLFHLSIPEKIQLVEDLWDSIAVHPETVELTPAIKKELDKRLEEHLQHPDDVSDWDDVRSRLWKML